MDQKEEHIMMSKYFCTKTALLSFMFFLSIFFAEYSYCELSISSYCLLTIKNLRQDVFNLQHLVSLKRQGIDTSIKKAEFDQVSNAIFDSYGTTAKEYVMYRSKHRRAVDEYLKTHPEIKQEIDKLAAQRNALLEEYDSLFSRNNQ